MRRSVDPRSSIWSPIRVKRDHTALVLPSCTVLVFHSRDRVEAIETSANGILLRTNIFADFAEPSLDFVARRSL